MAVGPWLAIAAALAPPIINALTRDDHSDEEKRARELFGQKQDLDRDVSRYRTQQDVADRLGSMYGGRGVLGDAASAFGTRNANQLEERGRGLEKAQFEERMRNQRDANKPRWQDWIGPLLGAGSAAAGALKGDPLASRRENLAGAADEADFIRSQDLSPSQLATALEENDERTRSALFGSRHRMSPYDF